MEESRSADRWWPLPFRRRVDSNGKEHRFFRAPRIGSRRIRNRLVQKYGLCNISLVNVPKQSRKYFSDIFTTVIECKWRWCLLFFSLSFLTSWSLFAVIYYVLCVSHGDFDHLKDADWTPCIMNGNSQMNIFLFAFTTQSTIGYGFRYPTAECPLVITTMCIQFMVGVMCQTLMAGVIFAKLARPIKRAATLLFSKNAVICMRDGKLCFLFRVGDMRKSSLAEAHVRLQVSLLPPDRFLQMIKKCVTFEGELLPFHQFDMNVGYDEGLDRVFVIWPITICHEIDEDSPLYEYSKETLTTARFEIIAILEGVVESVGSTTQARTSYLPNEILWGKRFEKLVTYQRDNGEYRIDFGKFHNVYDVDTPTCSAKELDEMRKNGTWTAPNLAVAKESITIEPPIVRINSDLDNLDGVVKSGLLSGEHRGSKIVSEYWANLHNLQLLRVDSDEEDDDDADPSHPENLELVDLGIQHKKSIRSLSPFEPPGLPIRHKQSCVRRGPDLF